MVQGVGFRPFVYRLAHQYGLHGWVLNHSGGVEVAVEGPVQALERFRTALREEAPPLARIEQITVQEEPLNGYSSFEIRESVRHEGRYQLISPDIATCPACLQEVLDPADRRYRYPFTNCTNCGPRFTIIRDIPYDRPLTTMAFFVMCSRCQAEYENPFDRRFHAQPNACPACGPALALVDAAGSELPVDDPLLEARRLLQQGAVVAVKGLGGFQLACDATDDAVVARLRQRKARPHKPFALMVPTLEVVERLCLVSPAERELLLAPGRPIVLLRERPGNGISAGVAPGNVTLGVMLPYTPLHHLLWGPPEEPATPPLVMTSGNRTEEPIACANDEALQRLQGIADYFLWHNRDIYARYDDSVWQVLQLDEGELPQPIRRARGYAPSPVRLAFSAQSVLACGPELKNTFCLTREEYAFPSPHIGDMENIETLEHLERSVQHYRHLFRIVPTVIACDRHPDYLATRYAQRLSRLEGVPLVEVQHHHAHIVACLAENGASGPVIGLALDGTGYGSDGHIWGGEVLVADLVSFRRAGRLEYLPLAGGEAAIERPYRIAVGYLHALLGHDPAWRGLPFLESVSAQEVDIILKQVERGLNAPLTSSLGRLFDAVSALLGVCGEASYEAQAAIELEALASQTADAARGYPFGLDRVEGEWVIGLGPLLHALVEEVRRGTPAVEIAARFHRTVAEAFVEVGRRVANENGLRTFALSGGCFQNRLLTRQIVRLLRESGFEVLLHRLVPPNDGGVSLGQAVVAHSVRASESAVEREI